MDTLIAGYRSNCVFHIGRNSVTKALTVGLKIAEGKIAPVKDLAHIGQEMKDLAQIVETLIRESGVYFHDSANNRGNFHEVEMRKSALGKIMMKVGFHSKDLNDFQIEDLGDKFKDKLGAKIDSLYFDDR